MIGCITDRVPKGIRVSPEDIAGVFCRLCDQNEYLDPYTAALQAATAIQDELSERGYDRIRITVSLDAMEVDAV